MMTLSDIKHQGIWISMSNSFKLMGSFMVTTKNKQNLKKFVWKSNFNFCCCWRYQSAMAILPCTIIHRCCSPNLLRYNNMECHLLLSRCQFGYEKCHNEHLSPRVGTHSLSQCNRTLIQLSLLTRSLREMQIAQLLHSILLRHNFLRYPTRTCSMHLPTLVRLGCYIE